MDRIEFYRKQYEQEREKNKVLTDVIVDLAKQEKETIAPQQTPEKVEKTPTPSPVKSTSQTGSMKSPVALSGKFLSLIMPTVNKRSNQQIVVSTASQDSRISPIRLTSIASSG